MKCLSAAVLTATLVFPLATRAQPRIDFSGTWKMDPARSQSAQQGEPFKSVTIVINQTATDVRIETTRGEQKETIQYPLSSAARAAAAGPNAANQPEAFWDGDKLVTETQRQVQGYTVTVREVRSLAPTAGEMTVETTVIVQHGYSLSMPGARSYGTSRDVFSKVKP